MSVKKTIFRKFERLLLNKPKPEPVYIPKQSDIIEVYTKAQVLELLRDQRKICADSIDADCRLRKAKKRGNIALYAMAPKF